MSSVYSQPSTSMDSQPQVKSSESNYEKYPGVYGQLFTLGLLLKRWHVGSGAECLGWWPCCGGAPGIRWAEEPGCRDLMHSTVTCAVSAVLRSGSPHSYCSGSFAVVSLRIWDFYTPLLFPYWLKAVLLGWSVDSGPSCLVQMDVGSAPGVPNLCLW